MDSITHIALGAIAGEAIAGKSLGKRAMFYGALAQSLPDIDFLGALFLDPTDNLLFHRGFTHSLLFGLIATLVLATIGYRWHRPLKIPYATMIILFGTEIVLHLILDICNAYGIGLFEPFTQQRFSFHVLFVADPFYSAALGVSLIILMTMDSKNPARRFWLFFGLLLSSGYFLYAISNKLMITRETRALLEKDSVSYTRLLTTPTPMNTWLWYIVVENDSGYHMGYRAIADKKDKPLRLTYVAKNATLLLPFRDEHDVKQLVRFSQDYFTVEQSGDTIIFNDLRFGQITGWAEPDPKYVFHYYVNYPDANLMVIQRGRFSNWNRKTLYSMIDRIRGND